jgi:hypothetical protein
MGARGGLRMGEAVCYRRKRGVMQASWAASDARGGVAGGREKWAGGGCNGSTQRFKNGAARCATKQEAV